jgi:hypothetical protein
MNAVTSQTRTSTGQGAGCGCGGRTSGAGCDCAQCRCDGRICALECLVRPNFFCGQLLTDADLAAMVEWTRQRLALARYRDGWGIACGLGLSCAAPNGALGCCADPTPQDGPSVYVNSGYALDCCGDDLVLCAPLKVDLSAACRPADDPCAPRIQPTRANRAATGTASRDDCLRINTDELLAIQLSLRYAEDLTHGQRALFRGACADDGPCQYARVREQPCVHLEPLPLTPGAIGTSVDNDEARWLEAFESGLKRQVATIRSAIRGGSQAVLTLLRHAPPYRYCFLEEMVCCLRMNETRDAPIAPVRWLQIARLLLVDWMLRQLECPCEACPPETGVPLGRVILRRRIEAGVSHCSVVLIEQAQPWRRPLRREPCRPTPARGFDLGFLLGQPRAALSVLEARDVGLQFVEQQPANMDELMALIGGLSGAILSYDPATGGGLGVHLVDDVLGVQRIAAFVRAPQP